AALITTTGFKKALSSRLLGFSLSIGRGLVMSFGMNTPQVLAGLLAAAAIMPVAQAQNQVVNVYNWAEYTAPDTLSGFQKATGIRVRNDVNDNTDTWQAKWLTGSRVTTWWFPPRITQRVRSKAVCSRSWIKVRFP